MKNRKYIKSVYNLRLTLNTDGFTHFSAATGSAADKSASLCMKWPIESFFQDLFATELTMTQQTALWPTVCPHGIDCSEK